MTWDSLVPLLILTGLVLAWASFMVRAARHGGG
jgi:hypothetical protein